MFRLTYGLALSWLIPTIAAAQLPPPSSASQASTLASSQAATFAGHPLNKVLAYARAQQAALRSSARDFRCRVTKRESIGGTLQPYQYLNLELREELRAGGKVVQPFAVFLHYLAPANVVDRKVLYVAGQNDGKMIVRKGGKRFGYVVVELDPFNESARRESQVPINEIGFYHMFQRMIVLLEQHLKIDPLGRNTKVQTFKNGLLNGRACTVIQVTHPQRQEGLEFHLAKVFIDDQLRIPARIEAFDWPAESGGQPLLLSEYNYTRVQMNVGLGEETFSVDRVND